MKYLIAGTGGVGGSIAGFLSLAGKDVTCIARGAHLQSIQTNGLKLKSDLKGEHTLRIPATTAEEFSGKADVIFVCVKGYSVDSIVELIKRAAHKDTVVIPILNVYGTGPRIQKLVPEVTVLDGCIYIVGFLSGTGEITQMGKIFRSGIWCSSRHGCEARIAGSHPTRLAGSRHKGRPVTRHQPGYVYQMVVYLCNGRNGCLLRRSDGRSTETGKDTEYIYRTFYGKRCLRKETRRRISRRPSQLQPESD